MEHPVQCLHEDRWDDVRATLRRIEDEMRCGFARVEAQQRITNGRVTRLERCLLLVGGIMIGAALAAGVKIERLEMMAHAAVDAAGRAMAGEVRP